MMPVTQVCLDPNLLQISPQTVRSIVHRICLHALSGITLYPYAIMKNMSFQREFRSSSVSDFLKT